MLAAVLPARVAEPRTLAEFPPGAFLETLGASDDGTILVTSYFARKLERVGADDAVATFAALAEHPVSLLPREEGRIVAVQRQPFTEGPHFATTSPCCSSTPPARWGARPGS